VAGRWCGARRTESCVQAGQQGVLRRREAGMCRRQSEVVRGGSGVV